MKNREGNKELLSINKNGKKQGLNISHGLSYSSEYSIWSGIVDRTSNVKGKYWGRYGGAGIYLDPSWREFEIFYRDMGPRPSPSHSIDRIDNKGPYSPSNCRWATRLEQNNNRKSNRFVTYKGETMTLAQLGRRYGVCPKKVRSRLRIGWTLDKAVTYVKK